MFDFDFATADHAIDFLLCFEICVWVLEQEQEREAQKTTGCLMSRDLRSGSEMSE